MIQFNPQDFIPQLSIDSVIFGYKQKKLHVLISELDFGKHVYTLPGGFIKQNQSIDEAALTILNERTGVKDIFLEQFKVFGSSDRKNYEISEIFSTINSSEIAKSLAINKVWLSQRFISIGYYALVDINSSQANPKSWFPIDKLPELIMDHKEIVTEALIALRRNLDEKLIGFNLLPETFTMRNLQELYEAVYEKPFARNNFQKKMLSLGVLERLEKQYTGAANKAPYLYRFKTEK
ncbi:MAG: NUDIX hydrolase [Cytophagales bacterium]|nr:NUDIX hydrolase [Cytophagales bacterium]